jgi:toxin-antitoxin system PIN domain toxin
VGVIGHEPLPCDDGAPQRPERIGDTEVSYRDAASILTRATGFMSDYDFTLNPYSGCGFGCSYCYAAFFSRDAQRSDSWGRWVEVKQNALEKLNRMRTSLTGKAIYMSSVTDPYQPIERRLLLVRGLLEALAEQQPRLVVQTRSAGAPRTKARPSPICWPTGCVCGSPGVRRRHRLDGRSPCLATAVVCSRGSIPARTHRCWMPRTTTVLLPDVNVLLAGFRTDHIHHRPARAFLEDARSQTGTLGISDVALSSLVRLATNPRVFIQPDTVDAVLDYIDALLEPPVEVVTAGAGQWPRFARLCRELNLRGNLVPDAYLAALAFEQRAELVTFDRGLGRYPRLRWRCLLDA